MVHLVFKIAFTDSIRVTDLVDRSHYVVTEEEVGQTIAAIMFISVLIHLVTIIIIKLTAILELVMLVFQDP